MTSDLPKDALHQEAASAQLITPIKARCETRKEGSRRKASEEQKERDRARERERERSSGRPRKKSQPERQHSSAKAAGLKTRPLIGFYAVQFQSADSGKEVETLESRTRLGTAPFSTNHAHHRGSSAERDPIDARRHENICVRRKVGASEAARWAPAKKDRRQCRTGRNSQQRPGV